MGRQVKERRICLRKRMSQKARLPRLRRSQPQSRRLAATIRARRDAGEESYTHQLLYGPADKPLKKVMEEAGEVGLAAKDVESELVMLRAMEHHAHGHEALVASAGERVDACTDHLRYEAADVVYHLLVVLERYGIDLDEFAAELNERMTDEERPSGAVRLKQGHVKRGK